MWGETIHNLGVNHTIKNGILVNSKIEYEGNKRLGCYFTSTEDFPILRSDNICSNHYPGFLELGIYTRSVEIILPNYIFSQANR